MGNLLDQRMLDRLVQTEATRHLLVYCRAGMRQRTDDPGPPPPPDAPPAAAKEMLAHVEHGGRIWLQPGSLGIAIATLSPGKGCLAGDQLHDATCEQPLLFTTDEHGERYLYFKADPTSPVQEGVWRHGRIIERQGWVRLDNAAALVDAIAERGAATRPVDLRRLPGYRSVR